MADPRQGLIGTIAVLAATVAALFAVALTQEEAPTVAGAGDQPQAQALNSERLLALGLERTPRVARRVEAIRGLRFDRVPEPRVSESARLHRSAERKLEKPAIKRELAVAEASLRLLGLLEADRDLGEVARDITALALAYYDTRRNELFLVGDAVPTGPQLAEFILAHELTHALEDQRFDLADPTGVTDDRALAESALAEGTATALMTEYARRHLDPLALAAEAAGLDAGASGELPRFAEAEVEFSYAGGADFVQALLGLGKRWALVDYALEVRAPATTEQILHPDKFLDDERAVPVAPPSTPGPAWRVLDTGSLGEFGTRELLREGVDGPDANAGAAGWGGDRYRLFTRSDRRPACVGECRSTHAFGIAWRGDNEDEARELASGLRRYVRAGLGGEAAGPDAWRLEGGWAAIGEGEDRVGLGLAPDARTARRIASAR